MKSGNLDPKFYEWLQSKGYTTDKRETTKRLLVEVAIDEDEIDIHSAKWYQEYYDPEIEFSSGWRVDYENDCATVETIEIDLLSDDIQSVMDNWYDYG